MGAFRGGSGVVAQNRLAIIDLVHGDPPVRNETSTIGAVLNGEIYNFQTVREELRRRGHKFSTDGDTEVLVHLFEDCDGAALARRLDGMFAFAIWDRDRRRLLLGRDRVGKKPLYYWHDGSTFVFASEIKGVLANRAVPRRLNPRALPAYLTFGYVPTPETFFDEIRSVPPAHVLTLSAAAAPELKRYWDLNIPGVGGSQARPLDIGMEEAASEVRALLENAIRRRLISDVRLGAFLSGGIDSSAIVALMSQMTDEPVQTFTIGFEERSGFDERPYARQVARRFGTEHHEEIVRPDAVELVEQLVWFHDQPFGDSSAIPTYLLNQVARRHVTVALSGDGGDELFAGYERFAAGVIMERLGRVPASIRTLGRLPSLLPTGKPRSLTERVQRFTSALNEGMPWAYLELVSYVPEEWRRHLLSRPDGWARQDYLDRWGSTSGAHPLDRLIALNIDTYLLDDLLVKADRMSMANGLEVRSPFLDIALLRYVTSLTPSLKLRRFSLKRVLKRSLAELLPDEILSRPKRGFGVPLDRWFRSDLQSYATSMLGPGASLRAHLHGAELDTLRAQHMTGAQNHGQALWTLLTLELFLRREGW